MVVKEGLSFLLLSVASVSAFVRLENLVNIGAWYGLGRKAGL